MAQNKANPPATSKENETASEEVKATITQTKPEETVVIKKSVLEDLMARLDRVEAVADKGQLAHFDSKNKGKMGKTVKLWTIDGKVVISWENMVKNSVERNPLTGIYREELVIKIKFEDGTEQEMDYVFFVRRAVALVCSVIKESKDMDTDDVLFTVKSNDGRVYQDINTKFIN
jgi:hypothetical protein